ncbi:MAG TPA: hypothetical protein PK482_08660 [Spirochaetota bacterium]|nr:hypothetical protein [Spirochaetota bacterium]
MSLLIYFAGLLIGVSIFLYLYSTIADKAERLKRPQSKNKTQSSQTIIQSNDTISFRKRPSLPPGTRICPLCGSSLTKYEGLYATKIKQNGTNKILIMGCRYCYKEDEDPLRPKKSSL